MKRPDIDKVDVCRHLLPEPGDAVVGELIVYIRELEADLEQTRVQLAGCSTAALGNGKDDLAEIGDYGWSASYGDVLKLKVEGDRYRKALELLNDPEGASDFCDCVRIAQGALNPEVKNETA